jgi:hypothetical protein
MSSKIFRVYYLTEYSFGRTILIWPRSRYRATSANGANTLGFHGREMKMNQRCVRSVSRLIGIRPESRTEKRQNGDKLVRCCNKAAAQVQHKTLETERQNAVKWCGWRGSNSHGTLCLVERRPTSLTGWRVNQFRHIHVVSSGPALYRAAGWLI